MRMSLIGIHCSRDVLGDTFAATHSRGMQPSEKARFTLLGRLGRNDAKASFLCSIAF